MYDRLLEKLAEEELLEKLAEEAEAEELDAYGDVPDELLEEAIEDEIEKEAEEELLYELLKEAAEKEKKRRIAGLRARVFGAPAVAGGLGLLGGGAIGRFIGKRLRTPHPYKGALLGALALGVPSYLSAALQRLAAAEALEQATQQPLGLGPSFYTLI